MSKPGIFIAVDGIDGAGKTTQVARLCQLFHDAGERVVCSKEPTDGPWGKKIRASAEHGRLPLREELDLFVRDRTEHVEKTIQPALDSGSVVIVDRYFYSTIAYQGIRGADVDELTKQMRSQFPIPDVALILDLPAALGLDRIANHRGDTPNEFETKDALDACREVFDTIASSSDEAHFINASVGIDDVTKAISKVLLGDALTSKRCRKPYVCDELYCAFRRAGECDWAKLKNALPT